MGVTLVTGASGFVGSHLMTEMMRRGLPVRGVTRTETPRLATIPSYNHDTLWGPHLKGIDAVVHLAARVHVMCETAADPLMLFRESNVAATINLARQAAEAGVRRFVFVSSIKVNGERTKPGQMFTADDPPNPQDPYGISKAEAEAALKTLGSQTGLEITIIRPPLVYGPGVRGNFRSLMKWAASGAPSIFSAVKNKRSFIHVENLCDLLILALRHSDAANRLFVASDGYDLSTHELLLLLTRQEGRRPLSIPVPPALLRGIGLLAGREEMVARLTENLLVDSTETRRVLGWRPPLIGGAAMQSM
jgi:nucleoside-diphosphate-sugar epimerase